MLRRLISYFSKPFIKTEPVKRPRRKPGTPHKRIVGHHTKKIGVTTSGKSGSPHKRRPDYHRKPRAPWRPDPLLVIEVRRIAQKFGITATELVEFVLRDAIHKSYENKFRKRLEAVRIKQ